MADEGVHIDILTEHYDFPLTQGILPLLWGSSAHESYWQSRLVAKTITQTQAP